MEYKSSMIKENKRSKKRSSRQELLITALTGQDRTGQTVVSFNMDSSS